MCIDLGRISRGRAERGLTLIELVLFIVIVSVGIAGSLSVFRMTTRASADPMLYKQATAIAEAIVEEVALKAFADPDGVSGETDRALMDDVDDYAYFDGSAPAKTISGDETLAATSIPGLAGYRASIAVAAVTLNGVAAKRIAVTVTAAGIEPISLFAYRTNR